MQGLDTSNPTFQILGGGPQCPGHYEEGLGSMLCFSSKQANPPLVGIASTRLHITPASRG